MSPDLANPFTRNTPEATFQDAVLRVALTHHWMRFHPLPALNRRGKYATYQQGEKGFPDLTLARDGVVLFRELKSETGSLSAEQKKWRDALGDSWGLWRPSMWTQILDELR